MGTPLVSFFAVWCRLNSQVSSFPTMTRFSGIVLLFCIAASHSAMGMLQPTKIENNGLYRLEIQSEDKVGK